MSLLSVVATSACQTIEDSPPINSRRWPPASQIDGGKAQSRAPAGTALILDRPVGEPILIEGTGTFVGDRRASSRQVAAEGAEDGVTLNLVNVPAPQAANTVLGDILGIKYTVDPTIDGKITIQTPNPVAKSTVIDLFQSALRSSNAAIVNANGTYKIVPVDLAPVGAIVQTGSPPEPGGRLGSSVQVVQLKFVATSEIRRILEPIAPRGGIIRADDARRTITLSGTSQEIAGMMEAISIFDVDVMKGMSFALVPVRTSEPGSIADELRTIFASEQEGPMAGMVQFLPNKRLGAILVISPQRSYLTRAADWVHRLDTQAAGTEKQFFTYSVQNRRAQELVDVLQSMFAGETGGARNGGTRNVAPPYQEASVAPGRMQQPPSSFGAPGFSYALKASNIAATLNALNQITDVNVISSPSLTVMDNRTAFLQVGDQVPITTQSAAVFGVGTTPIINSVSYRDTGAPIFSGCANGGELRRSRRSELLQFEIFGGGRLPRTG